MGDPLQVIPIIIYRGRISETRGSAKALQIDPDLLNGLASPIKK
jgi:hypothetical protein